MRVNLQDKDFGGIIPVREQNNPLYKRDSCDFRFRKHAVEPAIAVVYTLPDNVRTGHEATAMD
jgi:hypothetical protein